MAEVEDIKALQKKVYAYARIEKQDWLTALLEEHPELDVGEHKNMFGFRAFYLACTNGHLGCAQLLIDHKADVHVTNSKGNAAWYSALSGASASGRLNCVQLLVQKMGRM
jgi:ankyrin repeat protein